MHRTKFIYWLLEKITLGKGISKKVNGVDIKLPAKFIRYFPADYEADNFSFLKKNCPVQDAVILDIGAHIGLFAVIAAKFAGKGSRVFAFEPATETMKLLEQTIRINRLQEVVEPINQAMGNEVGSTLFFVSNNEADNSNSLVSYKNDRKLNEISVSINTVDNFVVERRLPKVDFIKFDVEGAEYDALRGAINVLKDLKPFCILAIHPEPIASKGDSLELIYDFIKALDYTIIYKNQPVSREVFCTNKEMIDLHLIPR